ncbi:SRPBCC family protein [Demequina sp. B12]|uniref:SRPBCC family protein n=1 Tax=Demequina sp. B12 TaxID=2992757 RepID=UPI00237AED61|nr:SRPBCC family protein [Demequina sp. B12]MDE0572216.1 SRPBCC family protein [Demequina sp. B12]
MPVTSVEKDLDALTMTVIADFAAPRERVWEAYTDPRQIEKFWGPVEWPATFTRHDVYVGGRSHYVMTSPEGEQSGGVWEFLAVDPGRSFEVRDAFADADGNENAQMPSMRMTFQFEDTESGSRLVSTTYFGSLEQLEQLIEMGMEQGMQSAMGQIDDVLADLASFASGEAQLTLLSDTQVRVSRLIRGTVQQVWDAHHKKDLLQKWLLGPDGWSMPVCEIATAQGQTYRYEWEPSADLLADAAQEGADAALPQRFGFTGEVLEFEAPYRAVNTESMIGMDAPSTLNEMTLTPRGDQTLLTIVITYPDQQMRDIILETGMVDGMEDSYARLEREVLS